MLDIMTWSDLKSQKCQARAWARLRVTVDVDHRIRRL